MPFPVGWPPRPSTSVRSIRFYATGTSTAAFADNGYLFIDGLGANTYTETPVVTAGGERELVPDAGATPPRPEVSTPMGGGQHGSDPKPQIHANTIRVQNFGVNAIEISFDGTNVHGIIPGTVGAVPVERTFRNRFEAGIALRFPVAGAASLFAVEAW